MYTQNNGVGEVYTSGGNQFLKGLSQLIYMQSFQSIHVLLQKLLHCESHETVHTSIVNKMLT